MEECKFGKIKYHRGRAIEGKWVFGGICRQTRACFLLPVKRRDKDTLLPIIRAQVLPGTPVMSDFVDPDTGAHTQGIENKWWGIKRGLPRTGTYKELSDSYLQDYMWRQHYGKDPFANIIKHFADLYEVPKD